MGANGVPEPWSLGKAEDLYAIRHWGKGYFRINADGNVSVHPEKDPRRGVDLLKLVEQVRDKGYGCPLLLRFPGILQHRLADIAGAFRDAAKEAGYQGRYRLVFPIKVNQQRHVIEEMVHFGRAHGF